MTNFTEQILHVACSHGCCAKWYLDKMNLWQPAQQPWSAIRFCLWLGIQNAPALPPALSCEGPLHGLVWNPFCWRNPQGAPPIPFTQDLEIEVGHAPWHRVRSAPSSAQLRLKSGTRIVNFYWPWLVASFTTQQISFFSDGGCAASSACGGFIYILSFSCYNVLLFHPTQLLLNVLLAVPFSAQTGRVMMVRRNKDFFRSLTANVSQRGGWSQVNWVRCVFKFYGTPRPNRMQF